jgi:hypothetical protein
VRGLTVKTGLDPDPYMYNPGWLRGLVNDLKCPKHVELWGENDFVIRSFCHEIIKENKFIRDKILDLVGGGERRTYEERDEDKRLDGRWWFELRSAGQIKQQLP